MKRRVIIYGKGAVYQKFRDLFEDVDIIAVADKKIERSYREDGTIMINPSEIPLMQYDYIVICTNLKYFEDIKQNLIGNLFVKEEQIVSYKVLIKNSPVIGSDSLAVLNDLIRRYRISSLLDINIENLTGMYYSKEEFVNSEIVIDGIGEAKYLFYYNIYNNIYKSLDVADKKYDAILITDTNTYFEEYIRRSNSEYIIIFSSYWEKKSKFSFLEEYGSIKTYLTKDCCVRVVNRRKKVKKDNKNTKIYVVTHKKYNVFNDELYVPIYVGNYSPEQKAVTDKTGENISYLNEKLNECTAIYWIWKNTQHDIVGINHYRRYFLNSDLRNRENILDINSIDRIFQDYDMITSCIRSTDIYNIEECIKYSIQKCAFERGKAVIFESLEKNQPDYIDACKTVMNGHKVFLYNMFLTKKGIFDEYCEWLFSFLIEAAHKIDISKYDPYSKRVIGFFAERMLTVWLLKQHLKIKELPVFEVL